MVRNDAVVCILMLGLSGIACLVPFRNLRAEEPKMTQGRRVVAKVDGKPIYEDRLTPRVKQGLSRFKKYGVQNEPPGLVKRLQKKALDQVIDEELIVQASQRMVIEDIEEKITDKLRALERRYGTGEGFESYLKRNKLTMKSVRASLRTRVQVDEYLEAKGISKPKLPEERIREAYEQDAERYSEEERIMVSHILLAVDEGAEAEANEEARKKAQEIHKNLLVGRDFAEMAQEHSDCNSASGGGKLGYIKRGFMPKEFDGVAFAMGKDTVSEVVRTEFGYHIIKIFDKKAARIVPYEEVRGFIERYLQEEESKKRLAAHIAELRKKARIEINE